MDLATLGLEIRSDGVVVANKRLRETEKQAKRTETATQKLAREMDKVGKSMREFGKTMSTRVTLPIVAAGAASVKFATDFESSFADVRKTVDATEAQFASMSREIRQLAKEVPTPVEELNRLAGVAGQLGVQRQNIVAFTRTIAMLGDASDIAGEQAALSLSRFMNVMGTAQTDVDRVGATIVGLGNNFAAMESEIVDTATSMAAFGNQMGLTEAQVLAYATAIAASGGQTEAASTAFQKTASTMQRAVIEMNEDLQLFASIAGVSAQQFADAFRDDASGAILLFLQGLKGISDQGQSTAAVLDELGLADQRLQREFGKLLGNLGQLEEAIGLAGDEWERNTALTEEAQKRYETFASQLGIFWNRIKDVGITLGNDLIPVIKSAIESTEGLLETFQGMDAETRRMVIVISALVAAIGPLLVVLGALVGLLAKLRPLVLFFAGPAGLAAMTGLLGGLAVATGIFVGYKLQETFKAAASGAESLKDQLRQLTPEMGRFTGEVARAREESLMARLDAEQQRLAEMERQLAESNTGGMAGGVALEARMQQQIALVQELSRELEINRNRWDAHNERVIEADNGIGAWGSSIKSAIDWAREMQGEMENLGSTTEDTRTEFEKFDEGLGEMIGKIETARERAATYAEAMIYVAESIFEAVTGMESFNTMSTRSGDGMFPDFGVLDSALDGMKDIREEMEKAARIEWSFENLIDSFHPLSQAMRQLGDDIELVNARIESGQMSAMEGMFVKTGAAANAAFGAIMSGMDRSSKEYEQMQTAQQAVNVMLGIAAILQQGMGDPYTAIPRMIAMAAMVAQLVDGISGLSGAGGGAEARQATQGTGSVLGDPGAKSESIANAVEITADATSELVGINRGMLHSLQQLQQGLSGAAGMVARGAGQFDASGITIQPGSFEGFMQDFHESFDPLGAAIDSWVGGLFGFGDTKITDQGIKLLGGAITDMTEGAVAQAFADLKRSSLFGSKRKTAFEDLDEAFSDQLNLIFASMIDTVEKAGEALGIPLDEIQARIERFEVQAQEISLKDLDAEEQQAELEAVFSRIFDDLASSVIPFIGQFQRVGEGMGETLVRVATSVQVAEEAIKRLGLDISDNLGPERMAQVSVGLIEAAGGIENFITQMESFMSKFAPEAHQFAVAESDITRALEQMNFALPESRQGFWELMQSIDGSTEAGQRQIATLLSLTDAADTYYSNLEEIQQEREGLERRLMELNGQTAELRQLELEALDESNRALQERIWMLEDEAALADLMADVDMSALQGASPTMASLVQLVDKWRDLEEQAIELGASENELFRIRRAANAELSRWISETKLSTLQLAEDFFSVDQTFQQVGSSVTSTINNMRDTALRALASIDDWLMSSQLDSNSPLPPVQQLGAAESQFMNAFEAAMGGDFDALADLPALADAFLSQAGSFYGTSTDQYNDIWQMVQEMMNEAADIELPPEQQPPNAGQIDTLIDTNSQFSTAIQALQDEIAASQLGEQLNALATATGNTPFEIAQELGFTNQNMSTLLSALGHDIPSGTEEELRAYFNNVIGGLAQDSDLVNSIDGLDGTIYALHQMLKAQLLDIVDLIGNPPIPDPPDGPPVYEGSGTYTPSGMAAPSNSATSQDLTELNAKLDEISRRIESGNTDRRSGLGMVVTEQQSTKRAIERKQSTTRAA